MQEAEDLPFGQRLQEVSKKQAQKTTDVKVPRKNLVQSIQSALAKKDTQTIIQILESVDQHLIQSIVCSLRMGEQRALNRVAYDAFRSNPGKHYSCLYWCKAVATVLPSAVEPVRDELLMSQNDFSEIHGDCLRLSGRLNLMLKHVQSMHRVQDDSQDSDSSEMEA